MAQVKAGIAYVDVRLGSVEQFKSQLAAKVKAAITDVSKRVDENFKKSLPKNTGESVGKVTSANMSKAFFKDAGQSFNAGMRALSQGQVKTFGRFMTEVGVAGGLGLRTGFESLVGTLKNGISKVASGIGSALQKTFAAIPKGLANAEKALNSFSQRVGFASFQITNLGFIASTVFTAPAAAALAFGTIIGIKTAAQIEQATAALKALTPAGTDVAAAIKRLQSLAQSSPIFATKDVVDFTQKMVASGLTLKQTEAFLKSFGNIALTVGADVNKIPYALEALVQMVGKGTVSMEELRQQLGDALPGAMKIVADAMGVTQSKLYDMVKAGKISGKELIAALTKLGQGKKYLDGASKGADTLGSKLQQLKESVSNKLGQIFLDNSDKIKAALDKLGPVFDDLIKNAKPVFGQLVDGFTQLVKKVSELLKWYNDLDPKNKDLVNKLLLIAVVAGPVIIALGGVFGALAGLASGLALVANPAGLVIVAIIAVGIAFVALWKKSDTFREKLKALWKSFKETVVDPFKGPIKDSINDVKNAWNDLMNSIATKGEDGKRNLSGVVTAFKIGFLALAAPAIIAVGLIVGVFRGLASSVGAAFATVLSIVKGAVLIIRGVIEVFMSLIHGDMDEFKKGIVDIWNGLWSLVVSTLANAGKTIALFVGGLVSGIVSFFKWLYNVLVGHSIIPDMVNAILDWFRRLVNTGKSVIAGLGSFFSAFYGNYIAPFVNAIKNGFDKVMSTISSIPGKIKNAFSGAAGWLVDAGRAVMDGMISGIKAKAGDLASKAASIAKSAFDAAKRALDINSPSRKFIVLGKATVEGFIKGLDQMTPKMMTEMSRFSDIVPEAATPSFGSPSQPLFDRSGSSPKAALNIENYYANEDADPRRQAEDWYFIVSARGGVS